jgi:hypothetical protein
MLVTGSVVAREGDVARNLFFLIDGKVHSKHARFPACVVVRVRVCVCVRVCECVCVRVRGRVLPTVRPVTARANNRCRFNVCATRFGTSETSIRYR